MIDLVLITGAWSLHKMSFCYIFMLGFPGGSDGKESARNARDLSSIPESTRSSGEGHGNLLQYSCLENPMDGGAWQATAHSVVKSWTWRSNFTYSLTHTFMLMHVLIFTYTLMQHTQPPVMVIISHFWIKFLVFSLSSFIALLIQVII